MPICKLDIWSGRRFPQIPTVGAWCSVPLSHVGWVKRSEPIDIFCWVCVASPYNLRSYVSKEKFIQYGKQRAQL